MYHLNWIIFRTSSVDPFQPALPELRFSSDSDVGVYGVIILIVPRLLRISFTSLQTPEPWQAQYKSSKCLSRPWVLTADRVLDNNNLRKVRLETDLRPFQRNIFLTTTAIIIIILTSAWLDEDGSGDPVSESWEPRAIMPNQEEEAAAHPLIYQKPDTMEEKDKSRNRILQSVEDSQRHYKIGER